MKLELIKDLKRFNFWKKLKDENTAPTIPIWPLVLAVVALTSVKIWHKPSRLDSFTRILASHSPISEATINSNYQLIWDQVELEIKNSSILSRVQVSRERDSLVINLGRVTRFQRALPELAPENEKPVSLISNIIRQTPGDFFVVVEGHTDDLPIYGKIVDYPSNWELSGHRAASVVRMLEDQGFPGNRMMLVGFGESRPAVPNRNEDGRAILQNQRLNRRVVIRLIPPKYMPF